VVFGLENARSVLQNRRKRKCQIHLQYMYA